MSAGVHAEIVKLARLLGVPTERLDYLTDLPATDLRRLREQATDVLFDANKALFERIGVAAKLVPASVSATIAQKALGPLICARITSAIDPERAVEVAGRLPIPFLADVAAELDPRRAAGVLTRLPTAQVIQVAEELIRRGDNVTMGRFVGTLPTGTLAVLVRTLDVTELLRSAVLTEHGERVGELFAMIPDSRIADVAAVVTGEDELLVADLLPLLTHLADADVTRLATAIAALPAADRARAAATASRLGVEPGPLTEALR